MSDFALDPIVLPLAISFFTFQQIAYLVDTVTGISFLNLSVQELNSFGFQVGSAVLPINPATLRIRSRTGQIWQLPATRAQPVFT